MIKQAIKKTMMSELKRLQNEYISAKINYEKVKEIEEKCKSKILNQYEFMTEPDEDEESERIMQPSGDFRMNDQEFERYCILVHAEYIKNGLNVPDHHTTPDYNIFKEYKTAGDKLIEMAVQLSPEDQKQSTREAAQHWKYRGELIELTLKLDLSL